jgi:nitrate reductase gamma subunit
MRMSHTAFFVGGILPYAAAVMFLTGVVYRLRVWKRVPQPALMTLYPTRGAGFGSLVKEALFFPSLYRGDKTMWILSWSFHATLALAFIGHLRVVTGLLDRGLGSLGLGAQGIETLSTIAGGAAGIVLGVAVATLLLRRIFLARIREISKAPDFLALLLLVAVITCGNWMRFGGANFNLAETRTWAASLLSFSPVVPTSLAFLLHLFFAQLLILYIAFSKLMHFGGFFFTFSLIKRTQP